MHHFPTFRPGPACSGSAPPAGRADRPALRSAGVALAMATAAVLGGCVVAPAHPPRPHPPAGPAPVVIGPGPAGPVVIAPAPEVVVIAPLAPPPPLVERVVVAPVPGYIWIGGYWSWSGGRHVWTAGHWAPPRPGYRWVPRQWVQGPGGWRQHGGHWAR